MALQIEFSNPSGKIPAGSSLWGRVTDDGNPDAAPDVGHDWNVYKDSKLISTRELSRYTVAHVVTKEGYKEFGFQLKPDVTGVFELAYNGVAGLSRARWDVEQVSDADDPSAPATRADIARLEGKIDQILTGLVK